MTNALLPIAATLLMTASTSAAQDQVRAAGMSLPDSALPTGSLTVRVVEGSFDRDVIGVPVDLTIAGAPAQRAATGAQGRAEFAHLPVGATVRASATVDGHPLISEAFTMPSQGGIRILLVVSDRAETVPPSTADSPPPPLTMPLSTASAPPEPGADLVRLTMILLTFGVAVGLGVQAYRNRRRGGRFD